MSNPLGSATPFSQEADAIINQDDASFAKEFNLALPEADAPAVEKPVPVVEDAAPIEQDSDRPRDESGKFIKKDEPVVEVVTAEADPVVEETPKRTLATQFDIVDEKGEKVDPHTLADTLIEFKADGEVLKVPLDKVVRLAQSGKYNERLQTEISELREHVPQVQAKAERLEQIALDYKQELERLIVDDDYLLKAREDYIRKNSPEEVLRRTQDELTTLRQQQEQVRISGSMETFVSQHLEPEFERIKKECPLVTEDEVIGRYLRAVQQFQRNGRVPENLYARVKEMVVRDIGPYATQLQDSRSVKQSSTEKESKTAILRAQETATKAKRDASRVLTPSGAPSGKSEPKRKPIVSARDAEDDIIADLVAGLGATV